MNETQILKYYAKSNKICPVCGKSVTMKDIEYNNYVFSKTKNNIFNNLFFAHKNCIKKRGYKIL